MVLSPRSNRIIFGGLVLIAVFNISLFYYGFEPDTDLKSSLERTVSSIAEKALKGGNQYQQVAVKAPKSLMREYYDDRQKGFMVVTHLDGTVWDDLDEETSRIRKLYSKQKAENFKIHEIHEYFEQQDPIDRDRDHQVQNGHEKHSQDDGSQQEVLKEKKSRQGTIAVTSYSKFQKAFIKFFEEIVKHIQENKPHIDSINNDDHYREAKEENSYANKDGRMPTYGGHLREQYKGEPVRTAEYLRYFLRLGDEEVRTLKNAHESYLRDMMSKIPEDLKQLGSASGFMKGDGIVYLGGDKYNQLVLTSVTVLRSTGCKMPVEVIIPKRSEFDIDLCNTILPKLNGKCRIMEDFVPADILRDIGGFQLKNVALLVSSFRNVLYLDADNIPVKNPEVLFVNEPFKSSRMIIWPDLWRRSTSPLYYEIADIEVDTTKQVRNSYFKGDGRGMSSEPPLMSYHDLKNAIPEASSETGQMMIDKEKHFRTLLLSLYYNFHGPSYYYPLFSQGAAGEGDKETFIAAAHKLDLPYYQVSEFNRELGPKAKSNKREYFGMGQYDPIIDYLQSSVPESINTPSHEYANDQSDASKSNYDFHFYKSYSLMFLHANWPKHYLSDMFARNSFGRGLKDGDKRRRLYSELVLKETKNFDIELHIMNHIKSWACNTNIQLIQVPSPGSEDREKICKEINDHIDFLKNN